MTVYVKTLETPIGKLLLAADEKAVLALVWKREDLRRSGIEAWVAAPGCALVEKAEKQLREYFRGERTGFDLPLAVKGTPFQEKVWAELRKIPFGGTWSYQELARRVGNPGAVRAVGTANGRNPVCVFIPCHRVVRASGELGGYAGGVEHKSWLLELERKGYLSGGGPRRKA